MKQQNNYTVSDDNNNNNDNKFNSSAKMNRNSLHVVSTTNNNMNTNCNTTSSTLINCHLCMRNLQSSPSLVMIINDHYYHRDCFKCSRCDKFLAENEAHTLIEHKYLYCGNCFIKRKPLQSTNSNNTESKQTTSPNSTTATLSSTTIGNNLNELKLKFESVQKNNNKYLNYNHNNNNNNKILNSTNNEITMSSNVSTNNSNMMNTIQSTVLSSFSSSSSSSNFSLSPSSSSSWSSSINSSTHHASLSLNFNSQNSHINQRITTYNNLVAASSRSTTNDFFKKRISNNLETPSSIKQYQQHNEDQIVTPTTPNLKRNDSKKTLFSSTQASPDYCFNTNNKNTNVTDSKSIPTISSTSSSNSNNNQNDTHLLSYKQHSSKCNIMIRKTRRGNKRSKSLPSRFNIDSLLDYLNCSMIINKYELKKLNYQRNMLLNSQNGILIYNSKNRYRHLLSNATHCTSYKVHQFSSGYNSENHSNSSNSTTNGTNTAASLSLSNSFMTNSTNSNNKNINFYRLSLSHLPLHFLHLQCTCGSSNLNSSIDLSRLNDALSSSSSIGCFNSSKQQNDLKLSSPNEPDFDYEDDDDDEDDDEDEDDEVEDDEELDLIENTSLDENLLNQTATLDLNNVNNSDEIATDQSDSVTTNLIKKQNESDIKFQFNNTSLYRAPGTSNCQHTVRVDVRRVRSCRDLAQQQYIFSPEDFIFKDKLGEGFFANVKKIISKKNNQEMVLKELKLSCINNNQTNQLNSTDNANQSLNGSDIDLKSDESLVRGDFLINYAELNAAHKSFLKEAQVLRNLNHPNVIKFMGIMFTKEKHLNLILEFISGGTLKDIIHNIQNILPWKLRVGYAKDIAAAMEYLHSLNIIHRDLKSDNCLVRENGRTVVVADFGLSRINNYNNNNNTTNSDGKLIKRFNDSFSTVFRLNHNIIPTYVQSPQSSSSATNSFIVAAKRKLKRHTHQRKQRYAVVGNSFSMAPEMLKHQIYDERVDIFSFGIICCEIIGRVQADPDYLPRTSDFGLNVELFRKKYCEADCPKHFIKIAIACCELEPDKRPPFTKTHLWLETILSHLESNNPIPKNLLKNILDQNTKRPLSSLIQN